MRYFRSACWFIWSLCFYCLLFGNVWVSSLQMRHRYGFSYLSKSTPSKSPFDELKVILVFMCDYLSVWMNVFRISYGIIVKNWFFVVPQPLWAIRSRCHLTSILNIYKHIVGRKRLLIHLCLSVQALCYSIFPRWPHFQQSQTVPFPQDAPGVLL